MRKGPYLRRSHYHHNPTRDGDVQSNPGPEEPLYTSHGEQTALTVLWGSDVARLQPLPTPP